MVLEVEGHYIILESNIRTFDLVGLLKGSDIRYLSDFQVGVSFSFTITESLMT